jgi:hypothetical protein
LFIEGWLIVEIKACKALLDEHGARILGYLRASGIEHGLLINFRLGKFANSRFANLFRPGATRAPSPMRDGHESSFCFASFVFFGGHFSFAGLENSCPAR